MRDFLMELYLKHGGREFMFEWCSDTVAFDTKLCKALHKGYVRQASPNFHITKKGTKYIKNLDNP